MADFGNNRVLKYGNKVLFTGTSGTFDGDVTFPLNSTTVISTTLSINGSVTTFGALALDTNATLVVNGSVNVNSPLRIASDAVIVADFSFVIGGGATLTPVVTVHPGSVSTLSLVVARFAPNKASGTFVMRDATASFPGSECISFGTPSQVMQSSSLSVTMSVSNVCGEGLPLAAIIGIAVGGAIIGIVVVVALVLVMRFWMREATNKARVRIKQQDMHDLAYQQMNSPR